MTVSALPVELLAKLRCPDCGGQPLQAREGTWACAACDATYPVLDGIPVLMPSHSPHHPDNKEVRSPQGLVRSTDAGLQASYWAAHPGIRDVGHPVVAGFARQRWTHLLRWLSLEGVTTALDVGCGNGVGSVHAPAEILCTGCDGSIALLRRHPGPGRFGADAERLPFASESFDLVFCWELLHHVEEPVRVLREMQRVTRRYVVIFEPNPWNPAQFLFALADPEHRWVLRFRRQYLLEQVRKAGLRSLVYQRCGWIFPNKTPGGLFAALIHLPFRVPFVGISQMVVASKEGATSH